MLEITKELHSFLVGLHYNPATVSHRMEHYLEHLFHLLEVPDEEDVLDYYGIMGHGQLALSEIACRRGRSDAAAMQRIDDSLHHLAITPEWQMILSIIKSNH